MPMHEFIKALMNAQTLPATAAEEGAPEWIQILPAGVIATDDDRGPYTATNASAIIAASFKDGPKIAIDECHSIDLAAPRGEPAPARGWIVEMQERQDGIWGRVEWTTAGAELVASKAYLGISPVILHDKQKQIHSVLRASLVNQPNFQGMASLHQKENQMNLRAQLIKMLGLPDDATDDAIMEGLKGKMDGGDTTALQSAMGQVGVALGLAEDANSVDIVAAAQAAKTGAPSDTGKDGLIAELQSSVKTLSASLTALTTDLSASASEAFYEKALQEKRAGVGPASKEHWVSLHQRDPAHAESLVQAMPKLDHSGTSVVPPAPADGTVSLNETQRATAAQLGLSVEDYSAQLKKAGA